MVREKEAVFWMGKWHFPCKKKRGFLGDGKFRRKPASHNIVLTLLNTTWRRNTRFLVDVIVRGRPTTPNVILAMLRG